MKKLILIIAAILYSGVAMAKVTYNNNPMGDQHLNTIKGFLYNSTQSDGTSNETKVSKTIEWIVQRYEGTAIYKLENINSEEALLVKHAITTIYKFLQGHFPGLPIQKTMEHWENVGSRVVVSAGAKDDGISTTLKLELSERRHGIENLVFHHTPTHTTTPR
jgi:hypothetical protein